MRYVKLTASSSLEITFLVQKYYFMPVELCYIWHFSYLTKNDLGAFLSLNDS